MKYLLLIFSLGGLVACSSDVEPYTFPPNATLPAEPKIDTAGFDLWESVEGDQTYLMKKYHLGLLKMGPNRPAAPDSLRAVELQNGHLAHLNRLYEMRKASLIGPVENGAEGELRGILVFNTPTLAEADSLAQLDPMVRAGWLRVEIHPWWTEAGGRLF